MKHNHILTASLLGGILLLAGCVKEKSNDDIYRPVGSEIVFGAETEYDNGEDTRTVYSGSDVTSGSTKYERIDWVQGDNMKIFYKVGSAAASNGTYEVGSSITTAPTNKDSKADVFHSAGTKLTWGTGGDHVFTAVYPASATFDGTSMSGSIPATQPVTAVAASAQGDNVARYLPASMSYAYMISKKTVAANSTTSRVDLPFTPAMTAFQFKFKVASGMQPVTVTKFEMSVPNESGVNPLTGDFGIKISGENAFGATWNKTTTGTDPTTFNGNNGRKITVNFTGGVQMNTSNYLDFTVMALPVDISKVTITFTFSDNTTKSMKLQNSGSWVTFGACKKWVITNVDVPGGESWTYYVEDIANINTYGHLATPGLPFTVKSYRKSSTGTYEAVKWKVQYSTDGTSWSNTQPSGWQTHGAKFSITTTSGNGSVPSSTGESNFANILRDHDDAYSDEYEHSGAIDDTEQAAIATMKGRGSLPSTTSDAGDGYFDLSKHPIYPVSAIDGAETTQETANCYVITRPGYYKFPLVYGNAINENATTATSGNNTMAYAPQGSSAVNDIVYYLRRFVRHDDKPITDPWIHNNGFTVADAVVVWQDVADASMQIVLDSDISISNNYVKFRIREANIRPGNVLIAARNSSGTILWSWHLWVTEKDLGPHTIVDGAGNTLQMMGYNLGWTDKVSGHGEHWVDWPFYVRIIQTADDGTTILNNTNPQNVDNTGAADVFKVTQYGESISVQGNVGSNTFYQWGRKDPLLPAASNNTNKSIYSAAYSLSSIIDSSVDNKVITTRDDNGTIGKSIQTPYNIFYSRQSQTIGTSGGNVTNSNHMFIGKATNNSGGALSGAAWYGNLWDTGLIAHIPSSGGANAVSVNNRFPIKSVYDPSPRGYVVPYIFAFTGFSDAAYNRTDAGRPKGSLSSDGEGYNFNDGNGGSIFLPFAGARGGDGANPLYDVNATMYYWTTGKLPWNDSWGSNHKSKRMAFFRDGHIVYPGSPEIYGQSDEYSEGAYSIRSVLQTAY